MIASSPKSQKKKIIITTLILGILSIIVFIYKESPPITFAQGVFQSVFESPKAYVYSLGRGERNDREEVLQKKIRELEQKIVAYQVMEKDNAALKSQFATSGETTQSMVAAKIIGVQGSGKRPHDFTINVGKADGINNNMTVVFEKYLVGKVSYVSDNYSVVITPFNPKFQVLAKLAESNSNGILLGRSDLMLLDGVLITDQIKKGESVLTKGEVNKDGFGVIPDIIIGKVASISKRETAPFQSAQVDPLIDYQKLTNVFVISQM